MRVVVADPGHQVPAYDRSLTGALAAAGHEVTLAVAPWLYFDPGPAPPGVALEVAFGRLLGRMVAGHPALARRVSARRALRLATYPRDLAAFTHQVVVRRPDVLHVQWSLVPYLEVASWCAVRAAGIPVVLTAHNVLPHEPRRWHPGAYRALYRSVDAVIVHSHRARERLLALTAGPPEWASVVPMAADEPPGDPPDRSAARAALGLPLECPLVLFFGHVRPYKGLDLLLAAWPAVLAAVPAARLLVAGPVAGGPAAVRQLRARLTAAGLDRVVDLWPGHVATDQVDRVFAAADVVALPYRDTDDSAVLQAARGRARAVVATAVGGLPETLAAGGGQLVPPGAAAALAGALITVLLSPARRSALEAEARAAARTWSWADVAQSTLAVYRALRREQP